MNRQRLLVLAAIVAALAVVGLAVTFLAGDEPIMRPPAPPNPPEG